MKKILSIFLCIMLLFALLSTTAFAADTRTFTIVITPEEGGVVSDENDRVSGPCQYEYNSAMVFYASANEGYHFAKWTFDNSSLGNPPSYNFIIDDDHTLTAVFEKHSYTYKSDADGHWYECSCGVKKGTSEKHSPKKTNEKAATDTVAGYTGDTICTVCNYVIEQGEEIPAKAPTSSKNTGAASSAYQGTTSSKNSGTTSSKNSGTTSSKNSGTTSTIGTAATIGTTSSASQDTNDTVVDESTSSIITETTSSETIGAATTEENDNKNNNNTILFVVIGVAGAVLIAAGIAAIILFTKKDEKQEEPEEKAETENTQETNE